MYWLRAAIKIFTGRAATPLYFVFVLIQLKIITPIMLKNLNTQSFKILLFVTQILWLALFYINNIFCFGITDKLFAIVFPAWMVYYFMGIEFRHKSIIVKHKYAQLLATLFVSCGIAVCESFILKNVGFAPSLQVSQLRITNLFSGIVSCVIVGKLITDDERIKYKVPSILVQLGNQSYGIYYSHYLTVIALGRIVPADYWLRIKLPIVQIIQALFVLTISVVLISLFKRMFGEKRMRNWLGF